MVKDDTSVQDTVNKGREEISFSTKKSSGVKKEPAKLVSGETYIYLKRLSRRLLTFVNKKYPGKKKITEWEKIFKKENII